MSGLIIIAQSLHNLALDWCVRFHNYYIFLRLNNVTFTLSVPVAIKSCNLNLTHAFSFLSLFRFSLQLSLDHEFTHKIGELVLSISSWIMIYFSEKILFFSASVDVISIAVCLKLICFNHT